MILILPLVRRIAVTVALALLTLTVGATAGRTSTVHAASYVVTTLADSGAGSLRQAILDANAAGGADTITFSVSGTITLVAALPDITDPAGLTIDGSGQLVTLTGSRLVVTGAADLLSLTISGSTGINGGGVYNEGGTLVIANSTISDNSGFGFGGIRSTDGTVTVTNSTISGNLGLGVGGGISSVNSNVTVVNSTISGNTSSFTAGGGGIEVSGGLVTVTHTTITSNAAFGLTDSAGGGVLNTGGTVTLTNTILAVNSAVVGPDCRGAVSLAGANIMGDTSGCLITGTAPIIGDALLGPLSRNGGPTSTHPLTPGSPAIDAADAAVCASPAVNGTDQRGTVRPQGPLCDLGAFELEPGTAFLSIDDVTQSEGDTGTTSFDFTVTLAPAAGAPVNVTYATANGTAVAPSDYAAIPPSLLTFAPGETSKTVTVMVQGDTVVELDETFFVHLSAPINAAIANGAGRATVLDDDTASTLAISDVTMSEGDAGTTSFDFTVTLAPARGEAVKVDYATADLTASAPEDYAALPLTTLTFAPGETSKSVTVAVNGDTDIESDELFFLNLTAPVNAVVSKGEGLGTITNDDVALSVLLIDHVSQSEGATGTTSFDFTVTLDPAATSPVNVTYATANGTAEAPSDYVAVPPTILTFSPGETSKAITVAVNGDTDVEPDESFSVNLSAPVNATIANGTGNGLILDDDTDDTASTLAISDVTMSEGDAGTTSFDFTISLFPTSTDPVQVTYATADGTAVAPGDYTAVPLTVVTFAPGETSKTISVLVNGDTDIEPDETFTVNLSLPVAAIIGSGVGTGTIRDDDAPSALSIGDAGVREGNTGTTGLAFTVTLSPPRSQAAQVTYATADGTATAGSDYTAIPPTVLNFAPGEITKQVTVLVNGDTAIEPHETLFVNLSSPVNATLVDATGQGTIVNDDGLGGKNLKISTGAIDLTWDGGGEQSYYSVARAQFLPAVGAASFSGALSASATSFTDSPVNGRLYCYAVVPLDAIGAVLGTSDLECKMTGYEAGTGIPTDFTLSLNQSSTASFTWGTPAGPPPDSYDLYVFPSDGSPVSVLPIIAGSTSTTHAMGTGHFCYVLVANRGADFGSTEVLCGLQGFSSFPAAAKAGAEHPDGQLLLTDFGEVMERRLAALAERGFVLPDSSAGRAPTTLRFGADTAADTRAGRRSP